MSQSLITIKGTPQCLIIYLATSIENDFFIIRDALKKHISNANGFFKGAKFIIKTTDDSLSAEQVQKLELICTEFGLIPYEKKELTEKPKENNNHPIGLLEKELKENNLFIQRNIRNGEKIYHEGNIIIVGDVNPGAEIAATGSIIVMGTVKGVVHAGVGGNSNAYIVASILDPLQIRIDKLIARKPENTMAIKVHNPEMAQIIDGQIIVKPYITNSLAKIS